MENEEDAIDQIFSTLEKCSEDTQREFIEEWRNKKS
jgi:hypothetical protein